MKKGDQYLADDIDEMLQICYDTIIPIYDNYYRYTIKIEKQRRII